MPLALSSTLILIAKPMRIRGQKKGCYILLIRLDLIENLLELLSIRKV